MSVTAPTNVADTIERCRPADVTPVRLDADALESTAPEYLRDLKAALNRKDLFPAGIDLRACFDEDCSIGTQHEVNRIRGYVRAGAFLGVGSVTVTVDDVSNPDKVRPALEACAERAEREGITLEVNGALSLGE